MGVPTALRGSSRKAKGAAEQQAGTTMQALLGSEAWAAHATRAALVVPAEEGAGTGAGVISYSELDQAATSIQRQLQGLELELPPGAAVAVVAVPGSPEACALLLAVLRAGLPLAPLSPALRNTDEIEFCLNDTKAALLLVPPSEQEDTSPAVEAAQGLNMPVARAAPYALGSGHLELLLLGDAGPGTAGSRMGSRRGSALGGRSLSRRASRHSLQLSASRILASPPHPDSPVAALGRGAVSSRSMLAGASGRARMLGAGTSSRGLQGGRSLQGAGLLQRTMGLPTVTEAPSQRTASGRALLGGLSSSSLASQEASGALPSLRTASGRALLGGPSRVGLTEAAETLPPVAPEIEPLVRPVGLDDVAVLLHTSGTTSRPKLVPVRHSALVAVVQASQEWFQLTPADRAAQVLPLHHVAGIVNGLLLPLSCGGAVVLAPPFDPLPFLSLLHKHEVSWFAAVPTVLRGLLAHRAVLAAQPLTRLRFLRAVSAPLDAQTRSEVEAALGIPVLSTFGMTEAPGCITTPLSGGPPGTLGKPIVPGLELQVVDGEGRALPTGQEGELCLRGPCILTGYLHNPAANEAAFLPGGWFRTGDIARLDQDGFLFLAGRFKELINRGGEKVGPATVESAASSFRPKAPPGAPAAPAPLAFSLAFPLPDETYGEVVGLAAVVADPASIADESDATSLAYGLLAHLRAALPPYQVPTAIWLLDSPKLLPVTAVGKPQRSRIAAVLSAAGLRPAFSAGAGGSARMLASAAYAPPSNDLEAALVAAMEEIIGIEGVGINDSFLELGGTSVQAARLAFSAAEASGRAGVTANLVLRARTAAGLAQRLSELPLAVGEGGEEGGEGGSAANVLRGPEAFVGIEGEPPLSAGQQQMMMLHAMDPEGAEYNQPLLLMIYGDVDLERLKLSLQALAGRHDGLRTTYKPTPLGHTWRPITYAAGSAGARIPLLVEDLSDSAGVRQHELDSPEVSAHLLEFIRKPFNLLGDLPVRANLLRLAPSVSALLLVTHHIASDGWSQLVLQKDLSAIYTAGGDASSLAPLPVNYAAFARWQEAALSPAREETDLAYWKEQLGGIQPLELPLDFPRPPVQSHDGALVPFTIPASVLAGVRKLAQANGATLFVTLLAAFQAQLAHYSQEQQKFAIGIPFGGRGRKALEGLVGYLVNMLAIPADLSQDPSFLDHLSTVRDAVEGALDHAALPFPRVVEAAGGQRDASRPPVFQVSFVLQEKSPGALPFGQGAEVRATRMTAGASAKFDLALELAEDDAGGLFGRLEYCSALFSPDTAQRIAAHFSMLLQSVVAAPTAKISELDLLTEVEQLVLSDFSRGPERPWLVAEDAPLLHEAAATVAAAAPDATALVYEGAEMSHGALHAAADALSLQLVERGLGPGSVVAIMLDRGFELMIAILGVLKAGACYLPADPSYPDDRLEIYVQDAGAELLLTEPAHLERARGLASGASRGGSVCEVVISEELRTSPLQGDAVAPLRCHPSDPAYIIFTSGSTGRPKGCALPHRGLQDLIPWLVELHRLDETSTVLFSNTICFDAHVMQVFPPLLCGGKLVIAKPGGHLDPAYIAGLIRRHQISSTIVTVPTLASEYLRAPELQPPVSSMRSWGMGGEAVPLDVVLEMQQDFPNCEVINCYGPTEVTAVTVHYPFAQNPSHVVIGRPDTNVHTYIVDSNLRPVPLGVPGELLLSGPRLGIGYMHRRDLTNKAFIPNPCLDLVAEDVPDGMLSYYNRAYRTGDLVRWRPDGTIDCLGRIDRQVKISGVRIELGEVEAALARGPGVDQAVAAAVPDANGTKRLVGYVTPASVDTGAILAHCRGLLVPAMVPSLVMPMEAFPLLPNGKVDVKGLIAPNWAAGGGAGPVETEYVAPAGDVEEAVARVFGEVLASKIKGQRRIGATSDFFAEGGTSLQVFRLTSELQTALGLALVPPALIHRERTPRGVAAALAPMLATDGEAGAAAAAALEPIAARQWDGQERPLSGVQKEMWPLSKTIGASSYNIPIRHVLARMPNVEALKAALEAVAARHEVLRYRFKENEDGSLVGVVVPPEQFSIPIRLIEVADAAAEAAWVEAEFGTPFDLSQAPLLRATLVRRADSDGPVLLVLVIHHSVGDGWSVEVLNEELGVAYAAAVDGTQPSWSSLPISYADWAAWEGEQLAGPEGQELRRWWAERLRGADPLLKLPLDRPRPAEPTTKSRRVRIDLGEDMVKAVDAMAARLRLTSQAVYLAALQAVLLHHAGQSELSIGLPVSMRERPEVQRMIGFFMEVLPLRLSAGTGASWEDLARNAGEVAMAVLGHNSLPLEDVLAASGVERIPGACPLFQVIFQHFPGSAGPGSELMLGDIPLSAPAGGVPGRYTWLGIDLDVTVSGNTLMFEYMEEIFDPATVNRLMGAVKQALRRAVADPYADALASVAADRKLLQSPPGTSYLEFMPEKLLEKHIAKTREWGETAGATEVAAVTGDGNAAAPAAHSHSGRACTACSLGSIPYERRDVYCIKCAFAVRRNQTYYRTPPELPVTYSWCYACYPGLPEAVALNDGLTVHKAALVKRRNSEEAEEGWARCLRCAAACHEICGLYNKFSKGRTGTTDPGAFLCPNCLLEGLAGGERRFDPTAPRPPDMMRAADLPHCTLSAHLEGRLKRVLAEERALRAAAEGKQPHEVPTAEGLTVRIVNSSMQSMPMGARFREAFGEDWKVPESIPYRQRVVLMWQEIEGVDMLMYCGFGHEWGGNEPWPANQRMAYCYFLDSLKYFEPSDVIAASAHSGAMPMALRTLVFQQILVGYLEYLRQHGCTTVHGWASPPPSDYNYVLYGHPGKQKVPTGDILRMWYIAVLEQGRAEGVVQHTGNMWDTYFPGGADHALQATIASVPQLSGHFVWRNVETILGEMAEAEAAGSVDWLQQGGSAAAGRDAELLKRLDPLVKPIRKDLMVNHLYEPCGRCRRHPSAEPIWVLPPEVAAAAAAQAADGEGKGETAAKVVAPKQPSVDDFEAAAARAMMLPPTTPKAEFLTLYGLYKQATVGDISGPRPGMLDPKGRAKFDAWGAQKGKGIDEAKLEYVTTVGRLLKAALAGAGAAAAPKARGRRFILCGQCHKAAAAGAACGLPAGVGLSSLVRDVAEKIPDAIETCGDIYGPLFDTRLHFISLCQAHHYSFENERRAKHCSMMVLHHIHAQHKEEEAPPAPPAWQVALAAPRAVDTPAAASAAGPLVPARQASLLGAVPAAVVAAALTLLQLATALVGVVKRQLFARR